MFELAIKIFPPPGKSVDLNGATHLRHEILVIVQVMDCVKVVTQYLPGMKEVTEIGAGIMATGITGALLIQGPRIVTVA
jgi:hypothetical protein